jgi:hypothetical protein
MPQFQLKEQENYESGVSWRDMKIVCAAVLLEDTVYFMDPPARHWNILHAMAEFLGETQDSRWTQGFLTDTGDFVMRRSALMIAERSKQLLQPIPRDRAQELFSEDVW